MLWFNSCPASCATCHQTEPTFQAILKDSPLESGFEDASWQDVLTKDAYAKALSYPTVSVNAQKFSCNNSANICTPAANYCGVHAGKCPAGYYLACYDAPSSGYKEHKDVEIQECANKCSEDYDCTRFEYNDGVWGLTKNCWLSND